MKYLLILLPFLLQLQGCDSSAASEGIPESNVLHSSTYISGEYTSKSVIVLTDQTTYEEELLARSSDESVSVDFSEESILLVDFGSKPSGGYGIEVSFYETEDYLEATIIYTTPGDNCTVTTAITNPYQFIKVEYTGYIIVNEELEETSC